MRSGIACTALAAILVASQAAAQSPATDSEAPQLPAELRKPAPIFEVPLPDAPPLIVEKPKPPPAPPAPVVEKRAPSAPAAVAPQPATKPRGECVIKPVMSDDDLYNCGAQR
jgi:hypothetical protein